MVPSTIGLVISSIDLWQEAQSELRALPVRVVLEQAAINDPVTLLEKLNRSQPDILLLEPGLMDASLAELITSIRSTLGTPHVIVVSADKSPESILAAMRAGASEYLYPPLQQNLHSALERISTERARMMESKRRVSGKIIALLSAKGGCGATTLACHGASEIARVAEKETLLADMDFCCGIVRQLMQAKSRYSMMDAMENLQRLDSSYWHGLVSNGYKGVKVVAATPAEVPRRVPGAHELRQVLRFVRALYDYTVADLGHGLEVSTLAAAEEADVIAVISTLEVPALQQTKLVLRLLHEAGIDPAKVRLVLNRIPRKSEIGPEDVESALGMKIFGTVPNDFKSLEQAYAENRLLSPDHPLRAAIGRVTLRLAGFEPEERRRRFGIFGL